MGVLTTVAPCARHHGAEDSVGSWNLAMVAMAATPRDAFSFWTTSPLDGAEIHKLRPEARDDFCAPRAQVQLTRSGPLERRVDGEIASERCVDPRAISCEASGRSHVRITKFRRGSFITSGLVIDDRRGRTIDITLP